MRELLGAVTDWDMDGQPDQPPGAGIGKIYCLQLLNSNRHQLLRRTASQPRTRAIDTL
jgi:hypothetical protein